MDERTAYDIPLNHLDFKYISSCSDVKELEKILKVLRSRTEGSYPELEQHCEDRLKNLDPKNKLLIKPAKPLSRSDMSKDEIADLRDWMTAAKKGSESKDGAEKRNDTHTDEDNQPSVPVRKYVEIVANDDANLPNGDDKKAAVNDKKGTASQQKQASKSPKPRDYREWDKLEKQLENADDDEDANDAKGGDSTRKQSKAEAEADAKAKAKVEPARATPTKVSGVVPEAEVAKLNAAERERRSEAEKLKGNEAFAAGQLDEAVAYYSRALCYSPRCLAALNNRALSYLRLGDSERCVRDCDAVLREDATNVKALLRKASALVALEANDEDCLEAIDRVLRVEPSNKQAQALFDRVAQRRGQSGAKEKQPPAPKPAVTPSPPAKDTKVDEKRKRLVIEEASDDEEQQTASDTKADLHVAESRRIDEKRDVEKQQTHALPVPTTNGVQTSPQPKPTSQDSQSASPTPSAPASTSVHVVPLSFAPLDAKLAQLNASAKQAFACGQYGDALQIYTQLLDALGDVAPTPNQPDQQPSAAQAHRATTLTNRAACAMKVGRLTDAAHDCTASLTLAPTRKALHRRAAALELAEKLLDAAVDYTVLLRIPATADDGDTRVAQQALARIRAALTQQYGAQNLRQKLAERERDRPVHFTRYYQFTFGTKPEAPNTGSTDGGSALPKVDLAAIDALRRRGNAEFERGDLAQAIATYSSAISELDATNPQTGTPNASTLSVLLNNRALCAQRSGTFERAAEDAQRAVQLDPNNVKAQYRLASALRLLGRLTEARQALLRTLALDANNRAALNDLAALDALSASANTSSTQLPEIKSAASAPPAAARAEANARNPPAADATSRRSAPAAPQLKQPISVPHTAYEFVSSWNALRNEPLARYIELLRLVERPDTLATFVSSSLDDPMLSTLIRCIAFFCHVPVDDALVDTAQRLDTDPDRGSKMLASLCTAKRISMCAMMLGDKEKQLLRKLLERPVLANVASLVKRTFTL